jgi:alpha-L-fucosidase
VTTAKDGKIWIHILDWNDETLTIPSPGKKVVAARMFSDRSSVSFTDNAMGLTIRIPRDKRNSTDTIVELEIR